MDMVRIRLLLADAVKQRIGFNRKRCDQLVIFQKNKKWVLIFFWRSIASQFRRALWLPQRINERFKTVIYIACMNDAAGRVLPQKQYIKFATQMPILSH